METLAQIIKEMRALDLTQSEVAEALGLSQAYISGIEKGKRGSRTPAETLDRARTVLRKMTGAEFDRRSTDKSG